MIDFFKSEKIIRLTPIVQETQEIADNLLAGDVRVFPKLRNIKVDNWSSLWEISFDSSPSTYALYVYALYPVSYLINAYELSKESRYLDEAVMLTLDFLAWESRDNKKVSQQRLKILFGDHAVSNRTQTLCYLLCSLKSAKREIPTEIILALLRNGEYLANIDNYSHYNHGLMMDLALLGLLNTLEGLKINYPIHLKSNLVERLQHSITRDLTQDGVHIENSPGYHFWMLGFLVKIIMPLEALDKNLHFRAKEALSKASEYAGYITRADGSVPMIGDTHSELRYKPVKALGSKFFQHGNQVIFRNYDDELWACFSSGYKTHIHKHGDNGAFNLFYKGKDIFIDPGFLNYEGEGDSALIKCSAFHNTVAPVGQYQTIKVKDISSSKQSYSENLSNSHIKGFRRDEDVEYALGLIADYDNIDIERLIVWIKPSVFLIYDSASQNTSGLEQYFHIAPGLTPEIDQSFVRLLSENGDAVVTVSSRFSKDIGNVPIKPSLLSAFYAKKFSTKEDSRRIVFTTPRSSLITVIELTTSGQVPVVIESIDGSVVQYKQHGKLKHLDLELLKSEAY